MFFSMPVSSKNRFSSTIWTGWTDDAICSSLKYVINIIEQQTRSKEKETYTQQENLGRNRKVGKSYYL